jgi:regulator of protease activity HflC (stomatin/prohibitin superfamily)
MFSIPFWFPVIFVGFFLAMLLAGVRILVEYERGVIFRLGRYTGVKQRISLREVVLDVPPQDVIMRDNVSVKVNAVLYFRVLHPEKSVIAVENYLYGTSQLAQTTLRSVCGQAELDELLAEREAINRKLQEILDQQTEPWGVKVRAVELKQIDLAQDMQRVMARQAEAEREKRSKVIHAEGEVQASQRLSEAARILSANSEALQLRYLQTLAEISTGNRSQMIFPLPLDLLRPFYERPRQVTGVSSGEGRGA